DICAPVDHDVLAVRAAQHTDLAARGRQQVDRLLDRGKVAMRLFAVADRDRAAAADLAERPEAMPAVMDMRRRRSIGIEAPGDAGKRGDKNPRPRGRRPVRQRPWDDYVGRVRPRGDDPIVAGPG